jgi:hypothetical protein
VIPPQALRQVIGMSIIIKKNIKCKMRNFVTYFFISILLVILLGNSYARSSSFVLSSQKETDYLRTKNEKVFVQLDKSLYISGDNIFYKAFIVNASSHQKELQSKIVYFELLGKNGKRSMFWRANTSNGVAAGKITIPDTVSGGVYTLKAYTNWMRNNSDSYYYATNILITKLGETNMKYVTLPLPYGSKEGEVEFISENNSLVAQLMNTVGVRVNSPMPGFYNITGLVKDKSDSTIATFKADTFGLASFSFVPSIDNQYKVVVFHNGVNDAEYKLPQVKASGMLIDAKSDQQKVGISISTTSGYAANAPVRMIASMRGQVIVDSTFWIKNNLVSAFIPNSRLKSGILAISIFNKHNEVLCEKLVYSFNEAELISVNGLKDNYKTSEVFPFSILYKNSNSADSLHLSVTVALKNQFQYIGANFSLSPYLLFFSEIANSYCLPNINDSFSVSLANNYLLAINPDEYYWNTIHTSSNGGCIYLSENRGYIFSGRLYNAQTNQIVIKRPICISFADSIPVFNYTITDSTGAFNFYLGGGYDNKDLVLQIFNPENENILYKWKLDEKNGNHISGPITTHELDNIELNILDNYRKIELVNAIYASKDIVSAPFLNIKNTNNRNFQFFKNYTVFPGDYTDLENFQEITENIMPGVKLKRNDHETNLYTFDSDNRIVMEKPTTVFFNGTPFYDIEYLADLTSKEIYRIDVCQSQVLYGEVTFYGIISIITKDFTLPSSYISLDKIVIKNDVKNYRPLTIELGLKNKSIPYLNSLLYLKHCIDLGTNSQQEFKISASELKGLYNVSVQGITNSGLTVSKNLRIELK